MIGHNMSGSRLRKAWQESVHANFFDSRAMYNLTTLRRAYENFNEFRLFLENKSEIRGPQFLEIGCATGELFRYLRRYHPEFHYQGFDISEPAIERAIQKYPDGQFELCKPDLSDLITAKLEPAVVWARDVVLHQPDPFEYLSKLLLISNEVTVLRLRTRDKGTTVSNPEQSCQWHYNSWVPYIVFNVDEAIETICQAVPVKKMIVAKSYVQLGGWHNRFLPKECYYPETGTAETAIYILRSEEAATDPEIVIFSQKETDHLPFWLRGLNLLHRKILLRQPAMTLDRQK
jgi:SAM-dependent methyltransferase